MLCALAFAIPEVGYCQGMNFIAATLLIVCKDEELAFWLFYTLMHKHDMKSLYLPGVPELHLKNFSMGQLVRTHRNKLYTHLRQIQMTPDYFSSKWIMTLFSNFLPFRMIPAIFDNFICEGWRSVYRIGIALLRVLEPTLLQMDMFEMSRYLRDSVRK